MKKIVTVLLAAIFAFSSFGGASAEAASKEKPVTIFLHGLAGGDTSMKPTIQGFTGGSKIKSKAQFRHVYRDPKSKLLHSFVIDVGCYGQGNTYVIAPDLSAQRFECTGGRKDVVSVVFAGDVLRNTANLELQMKMLKKVTDDIPKALKSAKGVNEKSVNLVGHSMGGILATNYALQSHKSKGSYLKVEKLVTLGSPIVGVTGINNVKKLKGAGFISILPNIALKIPVADLYGAVTTLHNSSDELTKRFKTMKLDPNTKVLSVYGTKDEWVSKSSALALEKKTKNFKSLSISAKHTEIQGHKTTIDAIKKHLAQ